MYAIILTQAISFQHFIIVAEFPLKVSLLMSRRLCQVSVVIFVAEKTEWQGGITGTFLVIAGVPLRHCRLDRQSARGDPHGFDEASG